MNQAFPNPYRLSLYKPLEYAPILDTPPGISSYNDTIVVIDFDDGTVDIGGEVYDLESFKSMAYQVLHMAFGRKMRELA